ncbi:MAG: energy-coupling factor transporter ATPase [Oscillospiraceae bacterium]
MTAVRTENLTYTYSPNTPFEKTAVDNVSIEIEQGETVGIIGHTGSGKSTLIQHFNGLLKPTGGKIYIDGTDIWESKEITRQTRFKVGMVFQYPEYQIFEDTIYKDISFGPKNMGLDEAEIKKRVCEAAEMVGLSVNMLEKSPFELSGGQKRRVAIAGVMAMNPSVLILDEPAAGLDPKGRNDIFRRIQDYQKSTGSTVLIVSHSMEDIAEYTSKLLVMNNSKLFCYDDTEKVFSRADELSEIGLAVPQITSVFRELTRRGFEFGGEAYTVKSAKKLILDYVKSRKEDNLC